MAEDGEKITQELSPGMEAIVYGGDTLVITDEKGQEFAVSGREREEVMDFLKAFDEWFYAKEKGISAGVLDALWTMVRVKFLALPLGIQREMPSFKAMGVSVGHGH